MINKAAHTMPLALCGAKYLTSSIVFSWALVLGLDSLYSEILHECQLAEPIVKK